MSDAPLPPTPESVAPATPAPADLTPGPSSKLLPILAATLAALGLITAFAAPGIAWLVCAAAIVVAIIALVKKRQPRGLAIAALIVAPIAWLIAIIVAVASVASGVGTAIDQADDAPTSASQPDDAAEDDVAEDDAAGQASIGDTVTNDDGVSFTVAAVACGLTTAGDNEFLQETASGQFCEVSFTLANGSDESINISASDVTGSIGTATYESNSSASKFGDDYFATDINPGLSADCVVYIDIPADKKLEYVTYSPLFSFGGDVVIAVP